MTEHVDLINRTVEQTNIWLRDMATELNSADDRREAYRGLRAFLHTLRDRITIEEAAQLSAQLPVLVRGIFFEGWRPSATPRTYHDAETFLQAIADEARLAGPTEASYVAAAGAAVLRKHVSPGEFQDVLSVLPADIRALLQAPAGAD